MPRFIFGDELGNIKSLRCAAPASGHALETKVEVKTIAKGPEKANIVQGLAVADTLLAAVSSNGHGSCYTIRGDDSLDLAFEWRERLAVDERFIALKRGKWGLYSCTSNGALRFTSSASSYRNTSIPTRLHDWRLSSNEETFAYGGHEVDLSVWDTEKAFATDVSTYAGQDRRANSALFPAETWRAKNVGHDSLRLRQPVRITSLTYLSVSSSANQHHLLTGTQFGDVRRYDTRAARKPVADWRGIGRTGGVRRVEKGFAEHEAFVSDNGSCLFAIDFRNGKIAYSYKGIAGAVTSIAPSPDLLASVSLDRFARLHSTFPLPSEPGKRQENKGQVIDKVFVNSIPTVIVWDGILDSTKAEDADGGKDTDEIWNEMRVIGHEPDSEVGGVRKKRRTG